MGKVWNPALQRMPRNIRHCLKGLIFPGILNYTKHDSGITEKGISHRSVPAQ
jgi:hypothetical protein